VDYTCGHRITRAREEGRGKGQGWLWLSVTLNLGLLGYFKYANFGIETVNAILESYGASPVQWTEVLLPVGISFYTFQTMSYTIDVYRGSSEPVRSFRDFACYVAMFPQLVAGPIVRYNTIADQLHTRTHTLSKFYSGVLAFQAGLVKKVLIADVLNGLVADSFGVGALATPDAWLAAVAYTFQIYFDFSGYSDMAIGLGLMMGFRFPINFNQPYRSVGITDFWRRWHISLSAFLRDYLYIPLGGNKKGTLRTYVNLSATMLLGGLWHGAAWNFIFWGAYQGFWLVVERLCGKRSMFQLAPRLLQVPLTFVVVIFGWILFRSETLAEAWTHWLAMLGVHAAGVEPVLVNVVPAHWLALAAGALVVWGIPTTQEFLKAPRPRRILALQALFLLALVHLHYQDHVPFLYFQF
jgi:alginate O-acetyltransferase complex protein AlgI